MRVVVDVQGQLPPAPAGASRRSTSSQSRVPSRRMSRCPSSSHPPPKALCPNLLPRQCDRDRTRWTSYPSTPLPPHGHHHLGAARARPRHRRDNDLRPHTACPSRRPQVISRSSNGPARVSTRQQPSGKRGQGTIRAQRNSCMWCLRTTGRELAARDLVGRRRRRRQRRQW
ncbi:hypothetical protein EDB89DRAFT_107730 [Lactarius sanguifluus]|nr:hypothetical protein EDB89DRAFT_107730 [Lactarius sanguifluus]